MKRMFRSGDGEMVCEHCLGADERAFSAELFERLFPGTYHLLTCVRCGRSSVGKRPEVEAGEGM